MTILEKASSGTSKGYFNMTEPFPMIQLNAKPSIGPKEHRVMIGITLCLIGHIFISVSLSIQKYFRRNDYQLRVIHGFLYASIMAIAEICNFVAYGYLPVTLMLSLAATTIISNTLLASLLFDEPLRKRDAIGIVIWAVGGCIEINFTKNGEKWLTAVDLLASLKNQNFIIYLLVVVALFTFILYLRVQVEYTDCLTVLLQVAIFGSFAVISTKAVSSMLVVTLRGSNQLGHPVFYGMLFLMVTCCVGQVKLLDQAVQSFEKAVVVPANFVLFTLSGMLAGSIFFQEFRDYTFLELVMFLLGVLFTFIGVFFVTGQRSFQLKKKEAVEYEEGETDFDSDELLKFFDPEMEEEILKRDS